MKTATGTTVIKHGQLIDGTGNPPVADAAVVIVDGRISFAGPVASAPRVPPDAQEIDARGGTIMPGLVEAHFHPTYFDVAELADLDIKYPVEYVTLLAAANAKLALECGYTAARSGGSLHNIDVWLKKAIENDLCPGPRLAASGREICGAGGLMDWNPEHLKLGMEGPRSWAATRSSALWSRASWPTCWWSTATCWPTSASWSTARGSSRCCKGA